MKLLRVLIVMVGLLLTLGIAGPASARIIDCEENPSAPLCEKTIDVEDPITDSGDRPPFTVEPPTPPIKEPMPPFCERFPKAPGCQPPHCYPYPCPPGRYCPAVMICDPRPCHIGETGRHCLPYCPPAGRLPCKHPRVLQ